MNILFKNVARPILAILFIVTGPDPLAYADAATLHYASNTKTHQLEAAADGFTLLDVAGSISDPAGVNVRVNALPAGTKALVWVGNLDNAPKGSACPIPSFTAKQFQAQVDALAGNPRVYGYYLSDEPHPSVCPNAATDIRARADYIHSHTTQKSFIVVLDGYNLCAGNMGCEYEALAPAKTHVDLIGIDPYPCHYDKNGVAVPCDVTQITAKANTAIAKGIGINVIVPVFQTFGQEGKTGGKGIYYRTPTSAEMQAMLSAWHTIAPNPVMDYSYTYGVQCSASACPSPQTISNHPEIKAIIRSHNTEKVTIAPAASSGL